MTSLIDLPAEVLIIVIRLLDSKSIYNLYHTCKYFRELTGLHGVVKRIDLYMNTLATAHSLKLDFFKAIQGHLYILNVCGMPDLKRTSLQPVMKRLKCLTTLDISYTNINMVDFIEMYQLCPSIKNISINFVFGKLGITHISDSIIDQCQNIFKNLNNVHFIGSVTNLLYSPLAQYILNKSKLDTLKYSVSECDYAFTTNHGVLCFENIKTKVHFKQFFIYILNWREKNKYYQNISTIPLLAELNLSKYEFVVTTMFSIESFNVCTSPLFMNFFIECFDLKAQIITKFDQPLFGNIAIMLWDKCSNNFDDKFFRTLHEVLKDYFPVQCAVDTPPKTLDHDWFYSTPKIDMDCSLEEDKPQSPKRRRASPNCYLNYDSVFKDKDKIMLSIIFRDHIKNAVTLSGSAYLSKLTFLNLSGSVRYSTDFFNILFTSCPNLITLNVEATSVSPCAVAIARSIYLNKCLQNIRLVDKRIDFKSLFTALSKCTLLLNIQIIENTESEPCTISDPSVLIEHCVNLYNLYIEAPMTESELIKNRRLLNKMKDKCQMYHVNTLIHHKASNDRYRYYYDPFLDVFKLSAVKRI